MYVCAMPETPRSPSPKWTANLRTHIAAYRQELLRVCPEVAEMERADLPIDVLPVEMLGVLRTLPNGAGLERLKQALDVYRNAHQHRASAT